MGHMDQSWVKLEPNLGQIRPKLAQNTNWTRVPILIVDTTDYRPHCSVSLYLFHGQITQKAVHQLSDPENKTKNVAIEIFLEQFNFKPCGF